MTLLAAMRCSNHPNREAAARCVSCGGFFCRECSTEHDGRMTCANCLVASSGPAPAGRLKRLILNGSPFLAGFLLIWLLFFLCGKGLISLPTSFHEGTLWNFTPNSP
jgi:hypothetical protein